MIGETFGSYQILEKRGEGGMGMFFKAKDLQLDRIVGLKTLRPELLADKALRERLQTEAKSLARLVHQNIANVLHYLVVGEQSFIVMEYVEGLDLADYVRRSGLVPLERLGPIVAQICAAISYAHSKNVIHRDLKPSNIMITEDWWVKVTDFGIAKILGDTAQTRTGMAAGSLHYMAPEQIRASGVDARTDIYQLGATLYELTAGRKPFVSDSEYELMTMHLQDVPKPPSSVNSRVSPAVDAVILKALAKDPNDRYPDAMELNAAFQAAMSSALAAGAVRGDSPTVNRFPMPSAETPTTFGASREEKTVVGPSRAKPKPPPRGQTVTPERSGAKESGKKTVWPWLAGAGALVVAVLLFLFWPSGKTPQTPTTTQSPTDTTATVVADSHATTTSTTHPTTTPTTGTTTAVVADSHVTTAPITSPTTIPTTTGSAGLLINVTPFDARSRVQRLWIDGTEQTGADLFQSKVSPGRHTIRFQVGSDLLTDTVTVGASGQTEKSFFVGSGRGRVSVVADFGSEGGYADIKMDGEATNKGTPGMLRDILEGPHEVSVSQQGYRSREGAVIVRVPANDDVKVSFKMVKR